MTEEANDYPFPPRPGYSSEGTMHRIAPLSSQYLRQSERGQSPSQGENEWSSQDLQFVAEEVYATDSNQLPESPQSLHFVPETGIARPHGTLRSLIRSNARRKQQRRMRNSSQAKLQPADRWNEITVSDEGSFVRHSSSIQRRSEATGIRLSPGPECNAVDPFHTLPISEAGHTQFLLHYCLGYRLFAFPSFLVPVNPKKEWIPFAMTDPALFHATLTFSAWSMATLQGKSATPEVLYHTAQSIQLLNKRLRVPNDHIATNSTIAAVSCLCHLESLSANAFGVKLHMDGLEALINKRGGIQALPAHSHVRKLSGMIDCTAAIVMETLPRFQPPSLNDDEEQPSNWGLYSSLALLYEAKLFHLTGMLDLSHETMEIYWGIRNLTALKEAAIHLTKKVEIESYSNMVERLERRVIALLHSEVLKSRDDETQKEKLSIFLLFGNAALCHIYMFMRDLPRGLPFYHLLAARLRTSIEVTDLQNLQKEYHEMMLWVLMIGGLGSTGTPHRGWFAILLAKACMAAGLRGGNTIAYALAEFMWSELYRSPVTIGFWNDVARAQGMDGGYEVRRLGDHISVANFNATPNMLEE